MSAKRGIRFLVSTSVASDPRVSILYLFIFGYEIMSNCSQNCWIDWNSAELCFKRLVHIGVRTFARFVWPLLTTILCVLITASCTCITHVTGWQQKITKKRVTAPILNRPMSMTRNRIGLFYKLPSGNNYGLSSQYRLLVSVNASILYTNQDSSYVQHQPLKVSAYFS